MEAQRLTLDGAFVVDAVPRGPGTYHLTIEPGDAGSWRGFLYPVVCQLQLPASGDVHATLPLTCGGRCEVEVLSKSGFASLAHFQLVDTAGRVCLTRWVAPGLGVDSPIDDFEGDFEEDYDGVFEEEFETSSTNTDVSELGVELDPARHVEQRAMPMGCFYRASTRLR